MMTPAPQKPNKRKSQSRKSVSWIGYRVKSFRDLTREDGAFFAEGTEFLVISVFRGLTLVDDAGRMMRRVPKEWVRVMSTGIAAVTSTGVEAVKRAGETASEGEMG